MMKQYMNEGAGVNQKRFRGERLNENDKFILKRNQRMGVHNIPSVLHKYTDIFDGRVHLAELFPFDELHTFKKGILQNTLGWVYYIVLIIGRITHKEEYGGNVGELDNRISYFCRHSTIHPFGNFKFGGISQLFKESNYNLKESLKKGVQSSGKVPAYQLPCIMWMVSITYYLI